MHITTIEKNSVVRKEKMKETMKCWRCKKKLTVNDIVISSSKWAYCKKCREPMLDMTIQPKEHFLKRNENSIEHDTDIHLMLKGFI